MAEMSEDKGESGAAITLDASAPLTFSEEEGESAGAEERRSERVARLLEAGDYPDKGLKLTEEDLDEIVAQFAADAPAVPVKVEHVDSPLDPLGHVKRVWREGAALFGTLAFPDDLAAFLRRRGAAKLSVGLQRAPLALREVSLVLKPRVAGAVLMSEATRMSEAARMSAGEAEIAHLKAELMRRDVDVQIAAFKAQGRLVPASEASARALLAADGEASVTLSEGAEPVAQVFRRFLEAQPPVVSFGEVTAREWQAAYGFTQDEHMFLSKRLGVDPARVAALIHEEQARASKEDKKEESHAH